MSAIAVLPRNKIAILGGQGHKKAVLNDCVMFDPLSKKIEHIPGT